ncbi:hypothetical protein BC830DRAFT_1094047 [Chytriomyces sp. MP71]|nr:hypothetical protein BC830DRAFT_1094047 [Chytriomyces sp. MP71]
MSTAPLRAIGAGAIVQDLKTSCIPLTTASCGSAFAGAFVLSSNVSIPRNTTYFSYYDPRYSSEADFISKLDSFLSDDLGFNNISLPISTSASARRYQATLFCSAAVFNAYEMGCYDPLSNFAQNGTYAACYGTCKIAVETLETAVIDLFGYEADNTLISLRPWHLIHDFERTCTMMHEYLYPSLFLLDSVSSIVDTNDLQCVVAVANALGGTVNDLASCGYIDHARKDAYCKNNWSLWCCQHTVGESVAYMQTTGDTYYYSNEFHTVNEFKDHQGEWYHLFIFMLKCFGGVLSFILITAVLLHIFNKLRTQRTSVMDLPELVTISEVKLGDPENAAPRFTSSEAHQPDYSQFFKILGLRDPNDGGWVADLTPFWYADKLGWIRSSDGSQRKTQPAVNPYCPLSNADNRPPLLSVKELPLATFGNKVHSLGLSVPFFKMLRSSRHKLGSALIAFHKGKMHVYSRFSSLPELILGFSVFILGLVMALVIWFGMFTADPGLVFAEPHSLQVIMTPIRRFTGAIENYGVSLLVGLLLLVIYFNSQKQKPEIGLLKYLRQVGAPTVEEVMISYSWEKGISETAHGVARCLIKSGIGCWIDVMKLGVSDDTAQITRTVAAHARFVVIFLTDKYLGSPACFIEFLEAVTAPNAKDRVIVYLPPNTNITQCLNNLCNQLESQDILILRNEHQLVRCLNEVIIHSNHESHLVWWQKYVGSVAGIPFEAIPPSSRQAPHLRRYNFFGWTPFKAISVSNIWVDSSLRKTGRHGASLPIAGGMGFLAFILTLLLLSVALRDALTILSMNVWASYNIDYGLPGTSEMSIDIFIPIVNLALQCLVLVLLVFIMSLSDSFDNRYRMHPSLRPLIASFNIRQHQSRLFKNSKAADNKLQYFLDYHQSFSSSKVKVLIYDFGTNNQVANTLNEFLSNLDLTPAEEFDYGKGDFGMSANEVFVPVFLFGASSGHPEELAAQVTKFGQIVKHCGLKMQDCVLIAADPREKQEVKGLFDCAFTLDEKEVLMSKFLILVEHFYKNHEFAAEVLFHIGLRVKGALERISQQSAKKEESHSFESIHKASRVSNNFGAFRPEELA